MKIEQLFKMRRKFNEAFSLKINKHPTLIKKRRWILQYKLLLEEVKEYRQACKEGNVEKIADALTDILYVLLGTYMEHGMHKVLPDLFKEVQRSNMSKLDENGKPLLNGINCELDPSRPYGKVRKSSNFIEPNFKKILKL